MTSRSVAIAVLSRASAAILGGYALASAATVFLAAVLPLARAEAVLTATLISFAVYTGAAIWCFAAASAARAWLWVALPALVLAPLGLWLGGTA